MARYIDFKELRQQISMEMILDHYGLLVTMIKTKDGLKSTCPIHNGNPKNKSFKVTPSKNLWKCFSPKCNKGGNVLDFVAAMEGCSIREAAEKLVDWFNLGAGSGQKSQKLVNKQNTVAGTNREEVTENKPLTFKLKDLQSQHSYFKNQGLNQDTVEYFGLGYYPGKGMMSNRIVVPIHNLEDKLVAYIGKDPKEVKADLYPRPENFNPNLEIYNLNRLKDLSPTEIDLYFNFESLWFYYQDLEAPAIALLTDTISQEQIKLLNEVFGESKPLITIHSSSSITEAKLKEVVYQLAKNEFIIELSIV